MANSLGPASIPFFACFCLLVVLVLHIVAFASPNWSTVADDGTIGSYTDKGLWRYSRCIPKRLLSTATADEECLKMIKSGEVSDWLMAVRGLETLSIIFWSIPVVIIPVYLYVALGLYYRCIMGTMALFTLLGCLCNIAGVILYAIKTNDDSMMDVGWCLIVAAVAGGLSFVAFIILVISFCKRPIFTTQAYIKSNFYVDPDRDRMYVIESVDYSKPGPLEGGHVNPAG